MESPIQPTLAAILERGAPGAIAVVVLFLNWPTDQELAGTGLKKDRDVARGWMSPEKIRALAALPQVRSIDHDSEARSTMVDTKDKIGGKLQDALREKKMDRYPVAITFSSPVYDTGIANLNVQGSSGWGDLTAAEIERLAQRRETNLIDLLPELRPR